MSAWCWWVAASMWRSKPSSTGASWTRSSSVSTNASRWSLPITQPAEIYVPVFLASAALASPRARRTVDVEEAGERAAERDELLGRGGRQTEVGGDLLGTINDARGKADLKAQEAMKNATGGLQLPPGFKMPF